MINFVTSLTRYCLKYDLSKLHNSPLGNNSSTCRKLSTGLPCSPITRKSPLLILKAVRNDMTHSLPCNNLIGWIERQHANPFHPILKLWVLYVLSCLYNHLIWAEMRAHFKHTKIPFFFIKIYKCIGTTKCHLFKGLKPRPWSKSCSS